MNTTRFQFPSDRVKVGKCREGQIIEALRTQAHLPLFASNSDEDNVDKVDCWLGNVPVQVKYRETGKDLLFEVFDTWHGWDSGHNKIGRDMFGKAVKYAVLLNDRKTVVVVPTALAKTVIHRMMDSAKIVWPHLKGNTFKYNTHGLTLELKAQRDPGDQRQKMIAYIPPEYFAAEKASKTYKINLPKNWK